MPKAHILIVEDDRIVAEDTRITLKQLGFGVSGIVSSGEDALNRVEAEPPDLVLMDIELEGEMDGIEAAARIRDRFNIPVVYVTGYADKDLLERAKVTEPFGYIVKPFEDREIKSVIEIALYKHKMETKLKESARKLQRSNDELERRVKERTAELQESNEELADEIEERTRIEEALSKNEQHLRSLMESAKGFILYRLMVDPKDKYKAHVVFVSPSIEDIMGVSPQEDFSEWFKNIHEDDLPSVMAAHKKSAETGVLFDQLMRIYHPGKGEWSWIRCISNPVFDSDGNPAYYNGLMLDITAEKRAEEELEKLQAQLVRSERLAATGQLAASIAHEINSPLQAVTFMLSSMGERWKNEKELMECIRILQGAFRSIRDTVKNLLDLNRPGKDEKQQTDVNRVIEKTTALIRTQLNKSGVTLNPDLSPQIPGLTASPQGLSHLFLNLFNNAIEAMTGISKPHGGETGLIRRGEINVKTNLGKGHVVIKVTDNGPGIPKEDMEHIFDPFYTRKKRMGLGVGLSVCHDIVKSHGGTITAENGPEGGAVFTITLPLD